MFGLFKSPPSHDFRYYLKATEKQLTKAVANLLDADQWLSGNRFVRDPLICSKTAKVATEKGHKYLCEAMWNAEYAMKAVSNPPEKDREIMMLELDTTCYRAISIRFAIDFHSLLTYEDFSNRLNKWDEEYSALKTRLGLNLEYDSFK